MKPYYDDGQVTIYHGDCREILPEVTADVMVTDPPYGVSFRSGWTGSSIAGDDSLSLRDSVLRQWGSKPALVFGSPVMPEPPGVVARLVWHRPGSGMGDLSVPWKPDWELVFVIGSGWVGDRRGSSVISEPWDVFRGSALHPHQKPIPLLHRLIRHCPSGAVVDPFMGSGSTLVAAQNLNRRAIGIEVEERYCEIAARRLDQQVLDLGASA